MASIEAKPGGGYAVRWREGRTARQQTCATRRDAERVKRGVEQALAEGRRWDPRAALRAPLLSDSEVGAADGALSAYLRSMRRRSLKASTIRQADTTLGHWLTWLESRLRRKADTADLSSLMLEDYLDARLAEVTPTRGGVCVRMVEGFWRWLCGRDEYAAHTPPLRILDLPAPRTRLQPYALTWAQVDAIITHERTRSGRRAEWRWKALLIQRLTGLRISQAARLEWRDLDITAGLLTIRPELGKSHQEARGRVVPVSPHLLAEVRGWGVREGYLVGEPALDETGLASSRVWRALVARAGYTREQVPQPTHCIRRTFIAELTRARVPEAVVKLLVGHDPGLTAGTYADHDEALREQAVEALVHIPAIGAAGSVCALGARKAEQAESRS